MVHGHDLDAGDLLDQEGFLMIGPIYTNDILFHPFVTIRAFGWRAFFRAVFEGQGDPFLSLLQSEGFFAALPASKERANRLDARS